MEIIKNIISWYPFEKESTVLLFNCNSIEVTNEISKNVKEITLFEKDIDKKNIIYEQYKNINNLTIETNIKKISKKYDYVVLIGLETITNEVKTLFYSIKKILNINGKLLISMNNKYSIKNLSTQEGANKILEGEHLLTIDIVKAALKEVGFENYKMYYPLTDYKFTNVLFTDSKLITQNEIARNIVYNNENTIKFFEENSLLSKMINDDIDIRMFTNSFFIEAFYDEYIENNIKYVAFSNLRKDKYKIKTIVEKDYIYKYADNKSSKEHIEHIKRNIDIMKKSKLKTLDTYDDEKIISKYTDSETFDNKIIDVIRKDRNKGLELIIKFKQVLDECMLKTNENNNVFDKYGIDYNKEEFQNITFVKYGLWDLIFQNCFYINDEFYFYDQEWMEENIPLNFIIFRAVQYLENIEKYIKKEELFKILKITQNEIDKYQQLDNKLQEEIRSEEIWKIHTQGKKLLDLERERLTINHQMNLLQIEKNEKDEIIHRKDLEITELKNKLNYILNSKSWKITKPLRKIKKFVK